MVANVRESLDITDPNLRVRIADLVPAAPFQASQGTGRIQITVYTLPRLSIRQLAT